MSQKNNVRHLTNCQITTEATITASNGRKLNVPSQKRKEDAKQQLYLNRI